MKINFKFWNDWRLNWGVMDYDFKFILFAIQHTNDDDFWGFKVTIFNFVFSWYRKEG